MLPLFIGVLLATSATANLFIPHLGGPSVLDPSIVAAGLGAVAAVAAWLNRRGYIGIHHMLLAFAALTFFPGALRAGDNPYASEKIIGLLAAFVICWTAMELLTDARRRAAFVKALTIFGVLVALLLIVAGEMDVNGRTTFADMNPIGLGRMAAMGFALCLYAGLHSAGYQRLMLWCASAICGYATLLTGSRGPLIAAILAVSMVVLVARSSGRRRVVTLALAAVVGLSLFALFADSLDSALIQRFAVVDGSSRNELWKASLEQAWLSPEGIGFGNAYQYLPFNTDMLDTGGYRRYSHNIFLEATLEGGWLALLGLLVLSVVSFVHIYRLPSRGVGPFMLLLWIFAFVNANVSSDLSGNRMMWVMIGAGLAVPVANWRRQRADAYPRRTYHHNKVQSILFFR